MKVKKCLYCSNEKLSLITHRSDDNGILKCSRCGVMMVENISDDTEKLYTSDYFEKDQGTKNGYTNYLSSPVANLVGKYAFARLFRNQIGKHLDLGCADGSLMEIFKNEGFITSGLEISKDAVKIANTKGLNVSFSRLHSFPPSLEKSDVITAFDLLEHADKPGAVLNGVYDNLNENGYFVFSTLSVKKNDPSDYWFNNSLEHYVYYNKQSLEFILSEVFGEGSFGFVEMEINGIAEFWGFAKKGRADREIATTKQIESEEFNKNDPEQGYLLSLFYNQVSKFETSTVIIEYFKKKWSTERLIQAKFYNNFYQGRLEIAVNESKENSYLLPASNSIYWQALCSAEEALYKIRRKDMEIESSNEILALRDQLFRTRDELHTLRNSRVVGRIIRTRDYVGAQVPRVKRAPRKIYHIVKPKIAEATPTPVRRVIAGVMRHDYGKNNVKIKQVLNEQWESGLPLVSVVIPYYNRADTIDDTLTSLMNQSFKNIEILIVDDGSTDAASIKKLNGLKKSHPDLKIITQKNQGVAAARNHGISLTRGKYVVCLDSDDMVEPTFIEKCTIVMESDSEVSLVTSYMKVFGVKSEVFEHIAYNPLDLYRNNMVITAAQFRKEAWVNSGGGYKSDIGYEDWEYWITLSERGFWGKLIPETLFNYRTSMQSRYVEDKDIHWKTLKHIRSLHPKYKAAVKSLMQKRQNVVHITSPETIFTNLDRPDAYARQDNKNKNILIAIPWMTFGGAETLVTNFCREISTKYNLSFVTGLPSANEWEYKFKEISQSVYHLPNLFNDEAMYLEFVSNYIYTRNIDVLHIIHTSFMFGMLNEIKKRHPNLKVIITMFNDRVPAYFGPSIDLAHAVDAYTTDNNATANHYRNELKSNPVPVLTIPNGIDCYDIYNPDLFNRNTQRSELKLNDKDLAVFFVGRLSEEKNPDVFLRVAERIVKNEKKKNIKFFVIGDGNMRPLIEKMIKSIGSYNVIYLGYQTEISRFLSAGDIFILPSSIEGFPLSILEAMAMKLVVIASDVGAVADVIASGQDGFVVKAGSVDEIEAAVLRICDDQALLKRVKSNARIKIENNYSNISLRQNYLKLYRDVTK